MEALRGPGATWRLLGGSGGLRSQVGGLEVNLVASWSQLGRFRCQVGGLGTTLQDLVDLTKNLGKPSVFIVFLSIGGSN